MKLSVFLAAWMLILSCAFASLAESSKIERPKVSLEEAVQITKAMLHIQGEGEKYYVIQAELFGGDREEGARWIISLAGSDGDRALVFIMTNTPDCSLHYHSREPAVRGERREVRFSRDGVSVVRLKNE